jgi:hypothetical protein
MATLDSRGLVDDGSSNLTITGLTLTGNNAMIPSAVVGSGSSVTIPAPGFYQVPVAGVAGQGVFTGSLPNPSLYPGADILITDTIGKYPYLITGSMAINVPGTGGIQTLSSSQGTRLTVPAGGTVGFWSDSKGWLLCAVSGSVTLSP